MAGEGNIWGLSPGPEGPRGPKGETGETGEAQPRRETKVYEIEGTVAAKTFLPYVVPKLATGEVVKLTGAVFKLLAGTSILCEVQINGEPATGFTELKAEKAAAHVYPTAIELKESDAVTLVTSSPVGTPEGLTFELVLEKS